ncbi:hypothetical protein AQJ91_09560 [Streptomyces dysideae]|uniref:Uncharacterized protein n=1 Tax=Streptomyces dysideae TaxID=909626 RepID=A0A117S1J8_9ACTN|nr:hypothetical protein AQJ91_09560 [Streptomyces dysideae]
MQGVRGTGLLGVLVAGLVVGGYGAVPSYGAEGAPGEVIAASTSPDPSRAGSRAGEGRERPGRQVEGAAESPDASGPPAREVLEPEENGHLVPSAPPPTEREAVTRAEDPAEPVYQVLPLGSGLVLIGLGLGLAFVGLRVRRG